MFEKVKSIVAESLGVEEDQITLESNFKDDLEADSLDLFEMVTALEDEFNVEIPTEKLDEVKTVGDVVKMLEAK